MPRKAAEQPTRPAGRTKLRKQSQEHLDKFLQEKPDHPDAICGAGLVGRLHPDEAMEHRGRRGTTGFPRSKRRRMARAGLEKAEPRFADAAEKFRKLIAAEKNPGKRRISRASGRTPASKPSFATTTWRKRSRTRPTRSRELLKNVSQAFDAVYQVNRGTEIGTPRLARQGGNGTRQHRTRPGHLR